MSDMDSMAATRASPPSRITSSHATPEPSQDDSTSNLRSPSPTGRSAKRRRTDSTFPEIHANSSNPNHSDGSTNYSSPCLASQSAPDLPLLFNGAGTFESQPRKFLGYDREFMSHILSTRGVAQRARATIRQRRQIPGIPFRGEDIPVISAGNDSFVGWREKADTWPTENGRHKQRSLTCPQ